MLDVTVANTCARGALDTFVDVTGSALAEAMSRKCRYYRKKSDDMCKLLPLVFFTHG